MTHHQVLTKRPKRMATLLNDRGVYRDDVNEWADGLYVNGDVYGDVTGRFLSLEPLLGPLPSLDLTGIDWVIVGGESGPGARPMHPDWVRDIRDRCVNAGIPFHFKQRGAWTWTLDAAYFEPNFWLHPDGRFVRDDDPQLQEGEWQGMWNLGKKRTGRELDGRTWDEFPGGAS